MDRTRDALRTLVHPATRDLVRSEAQVRQCAEGDLIEQAVLAYCQPGATAATEHLVFTRLLTIEGTLAQMLETLEALVTLMERQHATSPPPKIASYEEMYGGEPPPEESR